jgi:hypothetical protein
MDYDALLAEVLALLQQETSEQCGGEHRLSAGRRELPLSISLQSEKPVVPGYAACYHGACP